MSAGHSLEEGGRVPAGGPVVRVVDPAVLVPSLLKVSARPLPRLDLLDEALEEQREVDSAAYTRAAQHSEKGGTPPIPLSLGVAPLVDGASLLPSAPRSGGRCQCCSFWCVSGFLTTVLRQLGQLLRTPRLLLHTGGSPIDRGPQAL